MEPSTSSLQLEEFTSHQGDATVFYKILMMDGSAFVWAGTEANRLDSLTAAFMGRGGSTPSPAASVLLGPMGDGQLTQMAERLRTRVDLNLFLSINVSEELAPHVEERLVERFTV